MLGRGVPLHRLRIGRLALDTAACAGLSLVLAAALAQSATAQDAPAGEKAAPLKLQLNRLEPAEDSCRATIVVWEPPVVATAGAQVPGGGRRPAGGAALMMIDE